MEPWAEKVLKDLNERVTALEQRQDYLDKALASLLAHVPEEQQKKFRDEFKRLSNLKYE